ncbi:MAG: branched-chain amino acid ABC transporter permease [Bacillota bacterium]
MSLQLFINGFMLSGVYILVALGLTLIFSIMRIINFAHGELYMLGAFAVLVFYSRLGISYLIALLLAMIVVALLGVLMERFLFRPFWKEPHNCLILSLGLSIILQNIALLIFGAEDLNVPSAFPGVISVFNASLSVERTVTIFLAAVLVVGLYFFIHYTRAGLAIRAIAQDPVAAALQGMKQSRTRTITFGIGAALAAAAGGLMVPINYASPFIGMMPTMKAFAVIMLGGLGSIPGVVLGGLLLGFSENMSATFLGSIADMVSFVIIVLVLILRPKGLLGHE